MEKTMLRSRGITQPEEYRGPVHGGHGSGTSSSVSGSGTSAGIPRQLPTPSGSDAAEPEELRALVEEYHGFGMFSLIRAFLFRGWRYRVLALLTMLLVVGRWVGPFGYIAFKLQIVDVGDCPGGGGLWARFFITSVALIYTARLSVVSLSHTLELPETFGKFHMPKWWEPYRLLDLVVESLLYDTAIFIFNLFIVFQNSSVDEMALNVLALEFFTIMDDEFKCAILKYDSSFLDDMTIGGTQTAAAAAGSGKAAEAAAAAGAGNGSHSSTARLEEGAGPPASDGVEKGKRRSTCAVAVGKAIAPPLVAVLQGVRLLCLVGGPLFSCIMIVYGPYCLGVPEG